MKWLKANWLLLVIAALLALNLSYSLAIYDTAREAVVAAAASGLDHRALLETCSE